MCARRGFHHRRSPCRRPAVCRSRDRADAPAELELHPRKANGVVRRARTPRLAKREADDQALLAALRSTPEGSINDWATTIGKSRTSCVSALHRLRDAGLAESREGKWRLTEEPAPREPPAKWIELLSASQRAHAHA